MKCWDSVPDTVPSPFRIPSRSTCRSISGSVGNRPWLILSRRRRVCIDRSFSNISNFQRLFSFEINLALWILWKIRIMHCTQCEVKGLGDAIVGNFSIDQVVIDINWFKFEKRWADVFQIYPNAIHFNPHQFCPSLSLFLALCFGWALLSFWAVILLFQLILNVI